MDFTKLAYKVYHNDFLKITTENIIIPSLFLSTFYFLFPPPSPKVKKKALCILKMKAIGIVFPLPVSIQNK